MAGASTPIVDSLLEKYPNLKIQNKQAVEEKLKKLIQDGPTKLQFLSDFDSTMTKLKDGRGVFLDDSRGILERSKRMPKELLRLNQDLRNKYSLIEQNPSMTKEEKAPEMVKWTTQSIQSLAKCKVTREMIDKMVAETSLEFRDNLDSLVLQLRDLDVPFLVLSAGVGDLIEKLLHREGLMGHGNVKVVSNFLKFDENGVVTGLKGGKIIHVFNKDHEAIEDADYFKKVQARNNCILMGDMVGDVTMSQGLKDPGAVLNIGFLNIHQDKVIKDYLSHFDMVVLSDPSMEIPLHVVKMIQEGGQTSSQPGAEGRSAKPSGIGGQSGNADQSGSDEQSGSQKGGQSS